MTDRAWEGATHSADLTDVIMECTIYQREGPMSSYSVAYCDEADMHLIAAAPDLLAALRAASEVLVQDDCPMIYAQVQAALAKAEGRT